MKGRTWTAEETLASVLEGIKGTKPVAELCREHQIAQTPSDQWRDRFLEGGKRALTNGLPASEETRTRESEQRQRLIGQQAVVIELVKQPTSRSGGGEAGGGLAPRGLDGGGGLPAGGVQSEWVLRRAASAPRFGAGSGSLGPGAAGTHPCGCRGSSLLGRPGGCGPGGGIGKASRSIRSGWTRLMREAGLTVKRGSMWRPERRRQTHRRPSRGSPGGST